MEPRSPTRRRRERTRTCRRCGSPPLYKAKGWIQTDNIVFGPDGESGLELIQCECRRNP